MDLTGTAHLLSQNDLLPLHTFLSQHTDASLLLRSNLHAVGLADDGRPGSATYAGWWLCGQLVGVVAHAWNNNLILQAPLHAGPLARWVAQHTGRPLRGMCGPLPQLESARAALGRVHAVSSLDTHEDLFALALEGLRVPEPRTELSFRSASASDTPLLAAWRADFLRHEMGDANAPIDHSEVLAQTQRSHLSGRAFVLEAHGRPVAMCSHSARIPDCVQIGGVWTPSSERRKGYGRRVVAGALSAAREAGIPRAVLFTPRSNAPAQAVYRALGFVVVGDYGLVQWRSPQPFSVEDPS